MPSTYTSLHYHLVFATKHREPTIASAWRARLHDYLGGIVRGQGAVSNGVGGVEDHVHLLVGLKPTHCLSDLMRELKKISSAWVASECGVAAFRWQEGYGAFTVSPSALARVRRYIHCQEEHHRRQTYREEFVACMRQAGVEFDERYLD